MADEKRLQEYIVSDALGSIPQSVKSAEEMPSAAISIRTAASDEYHAEEFLCQKFYKPISRCIPE
ncbi:MAG TPA: hypothetical protein VEZ90_09255 [Blastocatellia bacterium]|nr:hypothetical protein [Blastocatellia bacterium]